MVQLRFVYDNEQPVMQLVYVLLTLMRSSSVNTAMRARLVIIDDLIDLLHDLVLIAEVASCGARLTEAKAHHEIVVELFESQLLPRLAENRVSTRVMTVEQAENELPL